MNMKKGIMNSIPRLGGDGMDNDLLRKQEKTPPIPRRIPQRHTNLNPATKTISILGSPSTQKIPHEPVKGAVCFVSNDKSTNKEKNKKSKQNFVNEIDKSNQIIKNLTVPFYNSNHLHINTNKTLQTYVNGNKQPSSKIVNNQSIPSITKESIASNKEIESIETREVEGKVPTNLDVLEKEVKSLQNQLEAQIKINDDLKRLLVASVGDDLQHSVEALVRTRAQLDVDMVGYHNKLFKEEEEVDKLSIQADMWYSKYMATKVLLDEVTKQRDSSKESWLHCRNALLQLLHLYTEIKDNMVDSFQHLQQLKSALGPHFKSKHQAIPTDVMQLSDDIKHYSDAIRFSLIGKIPADPLPLDSTQLSNPAELLAYQVLYAMPVAMEECLETSSQVSDLLIEKVIPITRFHPSTNYHNITFYCCNNCKGDIHVV